jgi:type I restriction enzyme S subunit
MRSDWPIRTIAECASPEPYSTQIGPFGKALMADQYSESGIPVLRGINVNQGRFHDDDFVFIDSATAGRLSKFESFPGDVLLVHKGTLGQIGLMPNVRKYPRYIMGNSMMRVRCDATKLLPEYLYYWLSSTEGQHYIFSRVSQVGVPQIQTPLTTLRQASLPVPPLSEQQKIVRILGTLDDKIDLNRSINETLASMARAVFKSWFVDFDSTLSNGGSTVPFGSIVKISRESLNPAEYPSESFDYYSIPAFDQSRLPAVEIGEHIKSNKFVVREDSVLLSKLNPRIPRVWMPQLSNDRRAICSTEFLVLRPNEAPSSREFLYDLCTSQSFLEVFATMVTGTSGSHQRVKPEYLEKMQVVVPSESQIKRYTEIVGPLHARIARGLEQSSNLGAVRDLLLPKFLSGAIRLQDIEEIAGVRV